jgi:hypothetical protein
MLYECKVSAALLELAQPYLATLAQDKRYQVHVAYLDQVKSGARQLYADLVQSITDTRLHPKAEILAMVEGALDALPSYHPILTAEDRRGHVQKLTQQIATTTDQKLKSALTQLRDAIEHRQIRT